MAGTTKKPKQMTLFGKRAIPKPYFKNPIIPYQKFVNKQWIEHESEYGNKQCLQEYVIKEWHKREHDHEWLDRYLSEDNFYGSVSKKGFFATDALDSDLHKDNDEEVVITRTVASNSSSSSHRTSHTMNAPRISDDAETRNIIRENYLSSQELVLIKQFFTDIGFDDKQGFFTDDVRSDDGLMKILASVAGDWTTYFSLLNEYKSKQTRDKRKTMLSDNLDGISRQCDQIVSSLNDVSSVRVTNMVATLISSQYLIKAERIKNLTVQLSVLQTKITEKNLIYALRRRLKQQDGCDVDMSRSGNELPKCFCYNNAKLTWDEVFDELVNIENSNISLKPLPVNVIVQVAKIMSENLVIYESDLPLPLNTVERLQILKLMPLMYLSTGVYLNLCEFIYTPGAFEIILNMDNDPGLETICEDAELEISEQSANDFQFRDELNANENQEGKSRRGRPCIVSVFPDIVNMAAEFVKQHGFSAQFRRRTETASSSGVTVREIRDNLLEQIPGLKEYGISLNTTRRLFNAPNIRHRASVYYKNLVDVRVGIKSNCYREFHPDAHYLFSRNKQRREFCSLFESECCILSLDDMAKLKVGAPAVSRYHQIKRLFYSSDMPNYKDHDFPVRNYLLAVSGYMLLENSEEVLPGSSVNDVESVPANLYDGSGADNENVPVTNENANENFSDLGIMVDDALNDSFWQNIVQQCLHQLNLKTSEEELKSTIVSELKSHKDFYAAKYRLDEDSAESFFIELDSNSRPSHQMLDIVSAALSSSFGCKVIHLDMDATKKVTVLGRYLNNLDSTLYIAFQEKDNMMQYRNVLYKNENKELYKHILSESSETFIDGMGRIHLATPYTGRSFLKIRSNKYNATTVATHVSDLYQMLLPIKQSKSIYMFISDGGFDFNPSHLANELFYFRLFKRLDADILVVMTFAARYSAFNPIEHLWAPLSRRLSSVVLSPTVEGENEAPVDQTDLDEETLIQKESIVFNSAMNTIREAHWKDFTFDGFKSEIGVINCNEDVLLFKDYEEVQATLKSNIRDLPKHSSVLSEFKSMHQHLDRHLNEVIFVKCNDGTCCSPFKSEKVLNFFGGHDKIRFPSPSLNKNGHYNTFLQEILNKKKRYGDSGQPNAEDADLGMCSFCPSFAFKSKTEKERHTSMFHRRQKAPSKPSSKVFKCVFEGCGKTFNSQPSMSRHQTTLKHRKRDMKSAGTPKATKNSASKKSTKKSKKKLSVPEVLRRVNEICSDDDDDESVVQDK